MAEERIIKKHPLAIRWFHWIHFPILGVMIWSGLLIYWANDIYQISFEGTPYVTFFPQSFYDALDIPHRLAEGMAYHFVFMWLFFLNGLLYVVYTLWSGEWRLLIPGRNALRDAWHVELFLNLFRCPALLHRAYQFPRAASLRMALSIERSATIFFSRLFSCSSCLNRFA